MSDYEDEYDERYVILGILLAGFVTFMLISISLMFYFSSSLSRELCESNDGVLIYNQHGSDECVFITGNNTQVCEIIKIKDQVFWKDDCEALK